MQLDFFLVMSTLTSLFALIAVGYAAVHFGAVSPNSTIYFSTLLMKVTLPCTIFISLVQKDYDPNFIHDSLIMIASGLIIYPVMLYSSKFIAKILRVKKNSIGIWAFSSTFSNAGFVAFPICLELLGREGLALAVMLNTTFNMTAYTIGEFEVAKDSQTALGSINFKSIILSSINFAIVASFIFYFGQIKLPSLIETSIGYVSNITTPLSMLLIGMSLAKSHSKHILNDRDAWLCVAFRLIIYPLILCILFRFIHISNNPMVSAVIIIVMAMPVASTANIIAETYSLDMNFVTKALFISNIACIITIPFICMFIG